MASRFPDKLADRILPVPIGFDKRLVTLGFLDRVQILALDVLDQRDLGGRRIAVIAHDRVQGPAARAANPRVLSRPYRR